jgi:hypothetical protein
MSEQKLFAASYGAVAATDSVTKGVEVKSTFIQGRPYKGYIIGADVNAHTYTVYIPEIEQRLKNVVFALPVISSLLGMKLRYNPPLGSKVSLLYGLPPIIIGMLESDSPESTNFSMTGYSDNPVSSTNLTTPASVPEFGIVKSDLLEGEMEISNDIGVALQLLTALARMNAGDRASVECHLLNEMVRIVSENYSQFSCMGETNIYNDGRLNHTETATSYEHEAWGLLNEKDKKMNIGKEGFEIDLASIDSINTIGRSRYHYYKCWLGDFIHQFISDPLTTIGDLSQTNAHISGKSKSYFGNDGTILLQSTNEIALEKVTRVLVPIRKQPSVGPNGNLYSEFDTLEKKYLKIWDFGGPSKKNIHKTMFQLREYARWLSSFHSLARFHQLPKEWKVDDEITTPAPVWTNKEKDVENANAGEVDFYESYSTIRIMRDGGILLYDSYGHTYASGKFGVMISSATDFYSEAAGDMRFVSNNMYLTARKNVEIAAIRGGLKLKARTLLHALCEWGSIWFKSDAQDPGAPGFTQPTLDDSAHDPTPEIFKQAILIDAPNGQIGVHSGRTTSIRVDGAADNPDDPTDITASVILESTQSSVFIKAFSILGLIAVEKAIYLKSLAGDICVKAKNVFNKVSNIFDVNKNMTFKANKLTVNSLFSKILVGINGIRGPKLKGYVDKNDPPTKVPLSPHINHIQRISSDDVTNFPNGLAVDGDMTEFNLIETDNVASVKTNMESPTWNFASTAEYNPPSKEIFQSLSQQFAQNYTGSSNPYATWGFSTNGLKSSIRTGNNAPSFGVSTEFITMGTNGSDLNSPLGTDPKSLDTQSELTTASMTIRFIK